jgi:hypothetical protein
MFMGFFIFIQNLSSIKRSFPNYIFFGYF